MNKRKTVCIDLDGTLAEYDRWRGIDHIGDPLPGAVVFVQSVLEFADVVIYTTRTNATVNVGYGGALALAEKIHDWLARHGFPGGIGVYFGEGKPVCAAFVDDRAVSCMPMASADAYATAMAQIKTLCGETP